MQQVLVTDSHIADVGGLTVRRALPRHDRRTIGAWCFVDHIGPVDLRPTDIFDTAPHPHCGLQTVTWLLEGEVLHRDSLGSEQLIRPGQLNLMTAGHGVSHSEEEFGARSRLVHGIQLWVALPEVTRHGAPAFEHHAELPRFDVANAELTVLVGTIADVASPARADTDHLGVDIALRPGRTTLARRPTSEYGAIVTKGHVLVNGALLEPGHLAYLPPGSDELTLDAGEPARLLLIGGTPFEARISMFWNFVARSHDEIDLAVAEWNSADGRFGHVDSRLDRIVSPLPPWMR